MLSEREDRQGDVRYYHGYFADYLLLALLNENAELFSFIYYYHYSSASVNGRLWLCCLLERVREGGARVRGYEDGRRGEGE